MASSCRKTDKINLWVYLPLLFVLIVVLLRLFFFFIYRVPNSGASPFVPGQLLLLCKQSAPEKGRYALVRVAVGDPQRPEETTVLMRITALPGDTVYSSTKSLTTNALSPFVTTPLSGTSTASLPSNEELRGASSGRSSMKDAEHPASKSTLLEGNTSRMNAQQPRSTEQRMSGSSCIKETEEVPLRTSSLVSSEEKGQSQENKTLLAHPYIILSKNQVEMERLENKDFRSERVIVYLHNIIALVY